MRFKEVNFDGLVGPTHNYAGLSFGNLASTQNRNQVSYPKRAALQGLAKMRLLHELGVEQAVLPPQLRPNLEFLRSCGFEGSDLDVLQSVSRVDPVLLAAASSAACMWTANAATVSPAIDSSDSRVHFTPANLLSGLHRSLEAPSTMRALKMIFANDRFQIHDPLPTSHAIMDEGAANHMRLAPHHGVHALQIFVFGRDAFDTDHALPAQFPARQTRQAFQAIARRHRLDVQRTLFWQQKTEAIDAGAFHNDVVAVANENVLLCHEDAFEEQTKKIDELNQAFDTVYGSPLHVFEVSRSNLSLKESVQCYLFNSQIVTIDSGEMVLVAPSDCKEHSRAQQVIHELIESDNPIRQVIYPDVRQSMNNGGGPACLRLRVLMDDDELSSIHQHVRFSDRLEQELIGWIEKHYRDELSPNDLGDDSLYGECKRALEELEPILGFEHGSLSGEVDGPF